MAPSPRKIAIVVTTSKKMMERSPSRPTCLQVGMSGDADDQRSKQQRRDDGLDQPQKDERQHAQVGGDVWEVVSDLRAQQHGDEDPCRERAAQTAVDDQRSQRNPAQGHGSASRARAVDATQPQPLRQSRQ